MVYTVRPCCIGLRVQNNSLWDASFLYFSTLHFACCPACRRDKARVRPGTWGHCETVSVCSSLQQAPRQRLSLARLTFLCHSSSWMYFLLSLLVSLLLCRNAELGHVEIRLCGFTSRLPESCQEWGWLVLSRCFMSPPGRGDLCLSALVRPRDWPHRCRWLSLSASARSAWILSGRLGRQSLPCFSLNASALPHSQC